MARSTLDTRNFICEVLLNS